MTLAIDVAGLNKSFGGRRVVKDVTLQVEQCHPKLLTKAWFIGDARGEPRKPDSAPSKIASRAAAVPGRRRRAQTTPTRVRRSGAAS